ncbi:MAG: tsf [Dehalococcoidia bacterium]|nr:tsf [Dehalococcoidia bacterium]MBF8303946.1 tsf [Dehalococcoidia bacterium]
MQITATAVKELRDKTGAGILECRNVLQETQGDVDRATQLLRERGIAKAEKKQSRSTDQGLVEAYIHPGGRIGAMVELNCETDFVARTPEFKELAHNIVLQVVGSSPQFVTQEDVPPDVKVNSEEACLLQQPFIKDPRKTIKDIIIETVAKVGENVRVKRFSRFELGN